MRVASALTWPWCAYCLAAVLGTSSFQGAPAWRTCSLCSPSPQAGGGRLLWHLGSQLPEHGSHALKGSSCHLSSRPVTKHTTGLTSRSLAHLVSCSAPAVWVPLVLLLVVGSPVGCHVSAPLVLYKPRVCSTPALPLPFLAARSRRSAPSLRLRLLGLEADSENVAGSPCELPTTLEALSPQVAVKRTALWQRGRHALHCCHPLLQESLSL